MSEAVRVYTGTDPAKHRTASRRWGRWIVTGVLAVVFGAVWWLTRDSVSMERVVPAGQSFYVAAHDLPGLRTKLTQSPLWNGLPPDSGVADFRRDIEQTFGVPTWIVNNLAPDVCLVTGRDLSGGKDAVITTRMSRAGRLLMAFRPFISAVQSDPAGGLHLNYAPDAGLYFAVRGRVLAIGLSRDALIRALTLRPQDMLNRDTLAGLLKGDGAEDLRGTVALESDDPLGTIVRGASFAFRLEPDSVRLKWRIAPGAECAARMGDTLAQLKPRELAAPPDGLIQLSVDLGQPLRDLWLTGAQAAGLREWAERMWQEWDKPSANGFALPQTLTALLGPLGPGIRVSWVGVDLNEMAPVPTLVATVDADPKAVQDALIALPPLADGADRYAMRLQYDAKTERAYLPLIGGPSMTPNAAVLGKALLISSSVTAAETVLNAKPTQEKLPERGNVYLRVQPIGCLTAALEYANLLSQNHLLKKFAPEDLRAFGTPWVNMVALVPEVTVLVSCEGREFTGDINVRCAAAQK